MPSALLSPLVLPPHCAHLYPLYQALPISMATCLTLENLSRILEGACEDSLKPELGGLDRSAHLINTNFSRPFPGAGHGKGFLFFPSFPLSSENTNDILGSPEGPSCSFRLVVLSLRSGSRGRPSGAGSMHCQGGPSHWLPISSATDPAHTSIRPSLISLSTSAP